MYITEQAAEYLAAARVRTVGVDYLSVGGYHADGARIHRTLLEAGIWIIEGLDLSPVTAGRYEMICRRSSCTALTGRLPRPCCGQPGRAGPGYASGDGAMRLPAVSVLPRAVSVRSGHGM